MRRITLLALGLAFCFFCCGVHAQVAIVGPDKADCSEVVMFKVTGVTLEDLTARPPKFGMVALPTPGMCAGVYDFLAGAPAVVFQARKPGEYYLVVTTTVGGNLQLLVHVIKVGTVPDPPNPPDPPGPDPPTPGGKKQVVIVYESSQVPFLPRGQQTMLASLTFRKRLVEAGHRIVGIVDQDVAGASAELAKYLRVAKADPATTLPALCFAPMDGGEITVKPLPENEDAVLEALK